MTSEEAIQQLEFDRAMILFDSLTGEEITPEMLKLINKENYLTYVADGIAIEALKEVQQYREIGSVGEIKQAIGVLSLSENDIIRTFHELNEYRKIGTVEECREAVEKQNPKKCVNDFCPDHTHYKCPSCGKIQKTKYGDSEFGCILNYCSNCGQALDENLEEMKDE